VNAAPEATLRVRVDATNPGQFFACCGLLETADRLWGGAEGWFEGGAFLFRPLDAHSAAGATLAGLLRAVAEAPLQQTDPADDYSSPVELLGPFRLRLDWWKDTRSGGKPLKVWAGTMKSLRIARAMQSVLLRPEIHNEEVFDHGTVVHDPEEPAKKVEPFYFDARRGSNARAIDIGFAPDTLHRMTTLAYPAVEFLCLVGLQRFRPAAAGSPRVFDYQTWAVPLATCIAQSAASGALPAVGSRNFRFEVCFRTDQKKHKAFAPATATIRS